MYAAVVDAMDQAIAQVLQTLDEEGIADDTIVLFHSDNGGAAYSVGGADNVPLRGGKGETYEGGIRSPLIVSWPDGRLPADTILPQYHHAIDVVPSLLNMIEIKMHISEAVHKFSGFQTAYLSHHHGQQSI